MSLMVGPERIIKRLTPDRDKVRAALKQAGKYERAYLVEFASMDNQTMTRLSEAEDKVTPYFSIIVVHGQGRRP